MTDSAKGKRCPSCGEPMADISSQFVRMCTGCPHTEAWDLNAGQAPLVTDSRDRGMQS